MKIIEALKKIKDLQRKASDIKIKISQHCVDLDCDTPTYPDQRKQISEWLQSYGDIVKEILHLRYSIQKTNVATLVTIELGNKQVTKSITEWIYRRKDLAKMDEEVWGTLTDRGIRDEQKYQVSDKSPALVVRKRLYFDPQERDTKRELYRSEPSKIDATLEIINATTELIER